MKRKQGFYWVMFVHTQMWETALWIENDKWRTGKYGFWIITGSLTRFHDNDFSAINETKLLDPDDL